MSRRPDFLIVGAPKCGTTAMARYLSAHPDVFGADRKDLHYCGSDLGFTRRDRLNEAAYLEHFDDARASQPVGELGTVVGRLMPRRVAQALCGDLATRSMRSLSITELTDFAQSLKRWIVRPAGTEG